MFTLARDLFNFGLVTLHLAQNLFTLARDLFNFGLVLAGVLFNFGSVAQDLFTLAGALFNFGLVCLAFSSGLVYFSQGLV